MNMVGIIVAIGIVSVALIAVLMILLMLGKGKYREEKRGNTTHKD